MLTYAELKELKKNKADLKKYSIEEICNALKEVEIELTPEIEEKYWFKTEYNVCYGTKWEPRLPILTNKELNLVQFLTIGNQVPDFITTCGKLIYERY